MKKRLISMALVVVMLVAMIPAFSITTAAADPTSYKTTVTAENVKVDGVLDDAYKYSQKITSVYWHTGSESTADFEAYTVLTVQGIYVWAEIKDTTLDKATSTTVNNGDKFQIYLRLENGTQDTWGWYETDYNGKVAKSTQGSITLADATYATEKLADGSGWRSETYIPFGNIDPMNIYSLNISMGFQVNNEVYNGTRYGLCFDHSSGASHWSSTDNYTPLSIQAFGDAYRDGARTKTAVYVATEPTVDGTKDDVYSDHGKITIRNVTTGTGFADDTRTELGDLYLSFTDSAIYAYYEVYDKDITTSDYCQFYYYFNNGGSPRSGYFCTTINPDGSAFYGSTGSNYGYPGTAYTSSEVTVARASLGNDMYSVEVKIPIPVQDRKALANDGSIDINFAFSVSDYAPDGPAGDDDTNPDRRAYGGCEPASSSMYNYNVNSARFPKLTLSKSFTDATPGVIKGASVALGSDISINYYAMVCPEDVENAYMKFIKNGQEYIAYPKASTSNLNVSRECTFKCEGMAPQTIGDNIRAELYVDGVMVASHDDYSVLQNCLNIYWNEAYDDDSYNNMKWLVLALINYGSAAQKYANYKTDALVNADYGIELLSPASNQNVRSIGSPISSTVKMTALGVYFDTANKVYVKFTAPSLSGITVTINSKPATIQKVADETDVYIAYSDAIPVLNFGFEQRIVLSDGTSSQTAVYSINSYTYSKYTSSNAAMAELAKATYTYGEYARKYANLGIGSYKIMTFNDADRSYHSNENYKYVAEIIKYYAPDIVGLQEVQQADASRSSSNYGQILTDYGIVYYDHGYPSITATNGLSESLNPSGCPIFYRTDRFTLVDSGRRWLSSTPDTASRVEGSDWTRSYTWAKLQDKKTGEIIVAVNTHIDYTGATYDDSGNLLYNPRLEQVKLLLELTQAQFGDLPIFYTADWNFGTGTDAYNYVNSQGYYATEYLMTNAYKPSSTIDCCFVDPNEFYAFDYKYINSHDFGEDVDFYSQVSDHPAILTEIALVEKAPQKDVPYKAVIEGPFNSADDTEGFN